VDVPLDQLKAALSRIAREDPAFLSSLLGSDILRNPHPFNRADPRVTIAPSAIIQPTAHVELVGETSLVINADCHVNHFAWLRAWGAGIRMGQSCTLNHYSMLQGPITLGDGVRIGAHSLFIATEHRFASRDVPIHQQGVHGKGITVGDDVYVGSNVTVLDGVTIGKGTILAAGAVVTRDLPEYVIAAGVPAKPIKDRPR